MKKYSKQDQRLLAIWAVDCAKHVIPFFEKKYKTDNRPRKAIEVCQNWINTGVFKMADIRGASLDAHAAARKAKDNAARFAARAAGQAVATAHVPQHAYGSSYYSLKTIIAANPFDPEAKVMKEYRWQSKRVPESLRQEIMNRIVISKNKNGIFIKIQKNKGF